MNETSGAHIISSTMNDDRLMMRSRSRRRLS